MGSSTKQQKDDQVMDAKTKKEIPTTKTTMGEGRIKILDKILKRGQYADKEINSANDYVKEDLKKTEKKAGGGMLKAPDNPGLKKLPESVRNNMGYMKKGGKVKKGYHRMPDGKVMKDSAHKKQSKCKRDGICVRGKTKGRMV